MHPILFRFRQLGLYLLAWNPRVPADARGRKLGGRRGTHSSALLRVCVSLSSSVVSVPSDAGGVVGISQAAAHTLHGGSPTQRNLDTAGKGTCDRAHTVVRHFGTR